MNKSNKCFAIATTIKNLLPENDIYYPVTHPEHNLVRTQNQLVLLEKMVEREKEMVGFVEHLISAN